MRFLVYLALLVLAPVIAGIYGALHDQISFSVSAEYFTKFKYHQFGLTDSPLPDRGKAALIGFLASWWMGLPIGLLVGAFGFLHRPARTMFTKSLKAFGVTALLALAVGLDGLLYGWFFASHDPAEYQRWFLPDGLEHPRHYLAVGHMHNFSYAGGVIGLLGGIFSQFQQRQRKDRPKGEGATEP